MEETCYNMQDNDKQQLSRPCSPGRSSSSGSDKQQAAVPAAISQQQQLAAAAAANQQQANSIQPPAAAVANQQQQGSSRKPAAERQQQRTSSSQPAANQQQQARHVLITIHYQTTNASTPRHETVWGHRFATTFNQTAPRSSALMEMGPLEKASTIWVAKRNL